MRVGVARRRGAEKVEANTEDEVGEMKTQRIVKFAALAVMGLGLGGCATNSMVASDSTGSGIRFGSLGIIGDNNNFTALDGSKLSRISVIGDGNTIMVEDGATLRKIEFWGKNNVVSVPANLVIRQSSIGNGNQVIPRGENWSEPAAEFQAAEDVPAIPANTDGDDDE